MIKRYMTSTVDFNHGSYLHSRAKNQKPIDDWYLYHNTCEIGTGGNMTILFKKVEKEFEKAKSIITHSQDFNGTRDRRWRGKSRTITYMFVLNDKNEVIVRLKVGYNYHNGGAEIKDTYEKMGVVV